MKLTKEVKSNVSRRFGSNDLGSTQTRKSINGQHTGLSFKSHPDGINISRDETVYALANTVMPAWMECPHEASMMYVAISAALNTTDSCDRARSSNGTNRISNMKIAGTVSGRNVRDSSSTHLSTVSACVRHIDTGATDFLSVESLRERFFEKPKLNRDCTPSTRADSHQLLVGNNRHDSQNRQSSQYYTKNSSQPNANRDIIKSQDSFFLPDQDTMVAKLLDSSFSCIPEHAGDDWCRDNISSRPRTHSRAIAIKQSARRGASRTNEDQESLARSPACEKMYDWATWRLYHRIVDHRQRHPLSSAYFENEASSESQESNFATQRCDRRSATVSRKEEKLARPREEPLDGEVFELDI